MPDDFPTISSTLSIYCLFTNNNKILIKGIHLNLTRKMFSEKNNSYIYKYHIFIQRFYRSLLLHMSVPSEIASLAPRETRA